MVPHGRDGPLVLDDEPGQEVVARRAVLGQGLVAVDAVVAHRRAVHDDARAALGGREGGDDRVCRIDPAVAQEGLARRGPSPAGEARAGEVDDGVGPVGQRPPAGGGPAVPALGPHPGGQPAGVPVRVAAERDDLVAVARQFGAEGLPDEPGPPVMMTRIVVLSSEALVRFSVRA